MGSRISRITSATSRLPWMGILMLLMLWCLPRSQAWIDTSYGWHCRFHSLDLDLYSCSKVSLQASRTSNGETRIIPAAGIPPELEELALFESLDCGGTNYSPETGQDSSRNRQSRRRVERISIDPPVFVLRNAITPEECLHIRASAASTNAAMEDAMTVSDGDALAHERARKHSRVTWLENDRPSIEAIARRAHGVFLNGMPFHATRGIEPLQVVHYHREGGEYANHHDGEGRLLTVLYYLNGVGATWFPLAGRSLPHEEIRNLMEARHACLGKSPGKSGVLVTCQDKCEDQTSNESVSNHIARVNEGDAVAFYSYRVDGSMNWKAFHSGLPVTGDDLIADASTHHHSNNVEGSANANILRGKWIANHFYHFVPPHIPETPPLINVAKR